jgi:hypothetical protein
MRFIPARIPRRLRMESRFSSTRQLVRRLERYARRFSSYLKNECEFCIRMGVSTMQSAKKLFRTLILTAAVTASFGVSSQTTSLWCGGTLSNIWVDPVGNAYVFASWRGDYVRVCNVNESLGTVTPTICLTWVSLLKSAVQRKATTTIYYTGSLPATCAQMPIYGNAPVPYYVMLQN